MHGDVSVAANGLKGKVGKPARLENWLGKLSPIFNGESKYSVTFEWDDQIGVPGAIIVRNSHENPFYLKTITLHLKEELGEDIVFVCNSWVYPKERYDYDRIFFSNKVLIIFIFHFSYLSPYMRLLSLRDIISYL